MSSFVAIDTIDKGSTSNAEFKITGIDNTFSRYLVVVHHSSSNYNSQMNIQVTKSGVAYTSAVYEEAGYNCRSDTSTQIQRGRTAQTSMQVFNNMTGPNSYNQETSITHIYLTNFADPTKYDYIQVSGVAESNAQNGYYSPNQVCVVKNASASDGILIRENSVQYFRGTMTLYGIKE